MDMDNPLQALKVKLSMAERQAVFSDNARALYGLS